MIKASEFARQAECGGYIGISYSVLDCQAFVEKVLKDCGLSKNWRGSNDMWRNAVHDARPIGDDIAPGEWVFTIKHDGKEDKSRYKDGVNAAHVGIYIGNGLVVHSTTGGVQYDTINNVRWTHCAKAKCIDYHEEMSEKEMLKAIYEKICGGNDK